MFAIAGGRRYVPPAFVTVAWPARSASVTGRAINRFGLGGLRRIGGVRPQEYGMQPGNLVKEGELFFRQWLRSPKSIGSVIPSSRVLARAVAAEVAWQPGQYVVELGGGTGAISQGLIERGIPRDRLIVVELDGALYSYLKERLPGCLV